MKVRLATRGVPRFCHDGLVVTESWTEIDWATVDDKVRAAIVRFHGRFVMTHPLDVAKWADVGLGVLDGKLVELTAEPTPEPATVEAPSGELPPARQPRAPRGGATR